jgi:hypothetical protein
MAGGFAGISPKSRSEGHYESRLRRADATCGTEDFSNVMLSLQSRALALH